MIDTDAMLKFGANALGLVNTVILLYYGQRVMATVQKTELNTNSMKDALVAATKLSAHAEGREEGRAEGAATAATLAQGVMQGQQKESNP
jgi:hypothetical protein